MLPLHSADFDEVREVFRTALIWVVNSVRGGLHEVLCVLKRNCEPGDVGLSSQKFVFRRLRLEGLIDLRKHCQAGFFLFSLGRLSIWLIV